MTKHILLTGGAGFIGSHCAAALTDAGHRVTILDDFSNAKPSVLDRLAMIAGTGQIALARGNILDAGFLDATFAADPIDGVIHLAAKKSVAESMVDPLGYIDTNIGGLTRLLAAMQAHGVFRLVFSSSATVYGDPKVLPFTEGMARSFANTYGFTKLVGEQICEQVAASDPRWAVGILRYFNPVGAHPSGLIGEDPNGVPTNLMPYVAAVAIGDAPALNVYGDDYDTPDGTGVRDYIHVCDLAEGHVQSLTALLDSGAGHTVNLGAGRGYSVLEVVRAYEAASGRTVPTVVKPRRAGDIDAFWASTELAERVLGFRATRGLDEMCASSWAWVQARAKANWSRTVDQSPD